MNASIKKSYKMNNSQRFYGLATVGHLKNVCPTLVQMYNRIANVEFTTVCHTIAKPML